MKIYDFGYQFAQLVVFAPLSALVAKTETVSHFIPNFETFSNVNRWREKLIEVLKGTASEKHVLEESGQLKSFDFNPLSEANRETVMIAATLAICTTTIFQTLCLMPGFKNSPKTTFTLSILVSAGVHIGASKFNLIPTGNDVVFEVAKNTLFVGGAFTTAAKLGKAGHKYMLPVLNFGDLLNPITSDDSAKSTPTPIPSQPPTFPDASKDEIQPILSPPPPPPLPNRNFSKPIRIEQTENLSDLNQKNAPNTAPTRVMQTKDLPPPINTQSPEQISSSVNSTKDLPTPILNSPKTSVQNSSPGESVVNSQMFNDY